MARTEKELAVSSAHVVERATLADAARLEAFVAAILVASVVDVREVSVREAAVREVGAAAAHKVRDSRAGQLAGAVLAAGVAMWAAGVAEAMVGAPVASWAAMVAKQAALAAKEVDTERAGKSEVGDMVAS